MQTLQQMKIIQILKRMLRCLKTQTTIIAPRTIESRLMSTFFIYSNFLNKNSLHLYENML